MKRIALLFGVLLSVALSACASTNVTAEKLTHDSIVQSEKLHDAKALTDAQFQQVNVELNRVAVSGREFTKLVIAKQDKPTDVLSFLQAIQKSEANLKAAYAGTVIGTVLDKLSQLENKISQYTK